MMAYEGAGGLGHIIVAKLPDAVSTGLVYNDTVQNGSFETGGTRWVLGRTNGTNHTVNVVSDVPGGVGFDNAPFPIEVPNGAKMAHTAKAGETGTMSVTQDVSVASTPVHSDFLGYFSFSVCPDSKFTTSGLNTTGRWAMVALEFKLQGSTVYTLAYNFTGSQLPPKAPPGFPSISRRISLTHPGSDYFIRYNNDLRTDVNANFYFDEVKIWIVPDMEDTIFTATFDILWDWFVLEVGIIQPALFPLFVNERVLSYDPNAIEQSAVVFSVLGTPDTVARFFDRSQMFFESSHEADPTTLRDISASEPFMLFSAASVFSHEFFRNNPSSAQIITDKGTLVDSDIVVPTNLITNGDFSQGMASWLRTPDTDYGYSNQEPWVQTLTSTSATSWNSFLPNGILPSEGSNLLYMEIGRGDRGPGVYQDISVSPPLESGVLEKFAVAGITAIDSNRDLSFVLQFFYNGAQVYQFTYRVSNMQDTSTDANYNIYDFNPVDNGTLQPAITENRFPEPAGEWASMLGNLAVDMKQASFTFDQVKVFALFGANGNTNEMVLDSFSLTVSVPPEQLRLTTNFAHVNTNAPLASGIENHLNISESDDVLIFDSTGPAFSLQVPAPSETYVTEKTTVAFNVTDLSSPLDAGNIDVWIDNEQVITASVPITTATWPSSTKQVLSDKEIAYEFFRGAPFEQGSLVTVSGELADLANPVSNQTIDDYDFLVIGSGSLLATISGSEDLDPPVLTTTAPLDGAVQVSPTTDIVWETTDNAAGVDPSTIKLYLNGALKVNGIDEVATGGLVDFSANNERGYDVTYNSDGAFSFGTTVTGVLEAFDLAAVPNFAQTSFEFTVTPDDTLDIINFFMIPGETAVLSSGTDLTVEVIDLTHGVASGTTYLTINDAVPSGIVTTFSGAGPDRMYFTVPLEALIDFREDLNVHVHAENNFPGSYPVVVEKDYIIRPGYEVVWPNKTEDATGGPESTFPFITNIQVLMDIKNYAKNFGTGSEYFRLLTEDESRADLGAYLESNIQVADLTASITSNNPFFEYGKEITVEIEADDFEGNPFRFIHTFKIESKP